MNVGTCVHTTMAAWSTGPLAHQSPAAVRQTEFADLMMGTRVTVVPGSL